MSIPTRCRRVADAGGTNPLLAESGLPLAAPRFDRIEPRHFLPAFRRAIAGARSEIEAIAGSPEPASFDNVIAALERAGASLARVRRIFWTLASASAGPEIRAIEAEVSAMLSRHATFVSHHAALF